MFMQITTVKGTVVEYNPLQLMSIARACRIVVLEAREALGDIPRASLLDLVADNLTDVPLETLKAALVCAGVGY